MNQNNSSKYSVANAEPSAASLIETFRAIGYSPETAMADIIDNSISANAKNIWITREWDGDQSYIAITDDGDGMNNEELINAMRAGCINPLQQRNDKDLGRFGMGLKTASFSQCRILTVISKKHDYHKVAWTWNLDHVAETDKWELLGFVPKGFEHVLDDSDHGTVVIWSELDQIIKQGTQAENQKAHSRFSETMERVRKHIAMTFHRFIEDNDVKIFWNNMEIESWDPFCTKESKTQVLSTDYLPNNVTVTGYVLPHRNNFSTEEAYDKAEGINGWPAMQGFYVYRNKRLLLAGDWLGLFRKEEHVKLVRIKIDIPNSQDAAWQIDIKKSRACPPNAFKPSLVSYAKKARSLGNEVYRHRGKIIKRRAGKEFQTLWDEKHKDGKWSLVINRDNLMLKELMDLAKTQPRKAINLLLRIIEESIPINTIYIQASKGEEKQKEPFSDMDMGLFLPVLKQIYDTKIKEGFTSQQVKEILKAMEPFNSCEDIIDDL